MRNCAAKMSSKEKIEKSETSSRTTGKSTSEKTNNKTFVKYKNCDVIVVLVSVAILSIFVPMLTTNVLCAKLDTKMKMLVNNEEQHTLPIEEPKKQKISENIYDKYASILGDDNLYDAKTNLYESELKRLSYETIHRILRDEDEPLNELRTYERNYAKINHELKKRSAPTDKTNLLNKDENNLFSFDLNENCSHFKSISLQGNNLKNLNFAKCYDLEILNLSNNNISEIPKSFPLNSSLLSLMLNGNNIESDTAPPLQKLQQIHLSSNKIKSLANLNLTQLTALQVLDLSCNQIQSLDTVFFPERMHNLKELNLAHNKLSSIYRETFYNLLSLTSLILSRNNITDIDYETFLALPNLQYLDLSFNQLKGDSIRALQGIPELMSLSIAFNPGIGASMQEFVASWSLKQLDASGTGLCKIPAALAQSVRTLKLTHNFLKIINCGDLDSYPLLQYLDLSYSHIEEIEDDALGRLEILETLFLDNNKLKKIPSSLPMSLEHLFLNDNEIMDIQETVFQGLVNLETLDLSGNRLLLYLPALQLPKLLIFNLQASGISGVNQAIVHTLPKLRDLYLDDNPIKCSDLLSIAEWASPCRENSLNEKFATKSQEKHEDGKNDDFIPPVIFKRIDLKHNYLQEHDYFKDFQNNCGNKEELLIIKALEEKKPKCENSTIPLKNQMNSENENKAKPTRLPSESSAISTGKPFGKSITNEDKVTSSVLIKQEPIATSTESMKAKHLTQIITPTKPQIKQIIQNQYTTQGKESSAHKVSTDKNILTTNELKDLGIQTKLQHKDKDSNQDKNKSIENPIEERNISFEITSKPEETTTSKHMEGTIPTTKKTQIDLEKSEKHLQEQQSELQTSNTRSHNSVPTTIQTTPSGNSSATSAISIEDISTKTSTTYGNQYNETTAAKLKIRTDKFLASSSGIIDEHKLKETKVQSSGNLDRVIIRNKKLSNGQGQEKTVIIKSLNKSSSNHKKGFEINFHSSKLKEDEKTYESIEKSRQGLKKSNDNIEKDPEKRQTTEMLPTTTHPTTITTITTMRTSAVPVGTMNNVDEVNSHHYQQQHKHEPLQLHLKDRHLIGTPLLMHKGENILVESEQLRLLPTTKKPTFLLTSTMNTATPLDYSEMTATIPITINHLAKSQNIPSSEIIKPTKAFLSDKPKNHQQQHEHQHQQQEEQKQEEEIVEKVNKYQTVDNNTDKDKKEFQIVPKNYKKFEEKKKLSLTMKKMTIMTKHPTTKPSPQPTSKEESSTEENIQSTTPLSNHHRHHYSVNTRILEHENELTTFKEHERLEHLLHENHAMPATQSKTEHWLDMRKETISSHSTLVICISVILSIILLIGLAFVFHGNKPWRRHLNQQRRPHLQRRSNEDEANSFLTYQKWQQNSKLSQNYNSPLHSLHVRELQKTTSLNDPKQNVLALKNSPNCSTDSRSATSSYSNSSQLSPQNSTNSAETFPDDYFYVEMPSTSAQSHNGDLLPMELLSIPHQPKPEDNNCATISSSSNILPSSSKATSKLLNDDFEKKNVRNKLTAGTSRKISIW